METFLCVLWCSARCLEQSAESDLDFICARPMTLLQNGPEEAFGKVLQSIVDNGSDP